MKLLFVSHYDEMLGANRSMVQLILELRETGVEPTVLFSTNRQGSALENILKKNSIRYIASKFRMIKHPDNLKVIPSYIYAKIINRKVIKLFKGQHFDIVHSNSSVIDIGKYIAKEVEAKHVWHMREFGDLDYNFKTPFGKWFQKIIYSGDNHFIAISGKIKNHYQPYIGKQPISLIFNGVKTSSKVSNHANSCLQFCIVGLLHENKRQFDVIKAVDVLVNQWGLKNFKVNILGSGSENYTNILKEFIIKRGLSHYINLYGQRSDVLDLLPIMDVGIIASSNEAFGRVTVEYMMANLAVIASDGGANEEIIEYGINGMIYKTGNVDSLACIMRKYIENREMVNKHAYNGFKRAHSEFLSSINSTKILGVYANIMQ